MARSRADGFDDLAIEPIYGRDELRGIGFLEDKGNVLDAQTLEGPNLQQCSLGVGLRQADRPASMGGDGHPRGKPRHRSAGFLCGGAYGRDAPREVVWGCPGRVISVTESTGASKSGNRTPAHDDRKTLTLSRHRPEDEVTEAVEVAFERLPRAGPQMPPQSDRFAEVGAASVEAV